MQTSQFPFEIVLRLAPFGLKEMVRESVSLTLSLQSNNRSPSQQKFDAVAACAIAHQVEDTSLPDLVSHLGKNALEVYNLVNGDRKAEHIATMLYSSIEDICHMLLKLRAYGYVYFEPVEKKG